MGLATTRRHVRSLAGSPARSPQRPISFTQQRLLPLTCVSAAGIIEHMFEPERWDEAVDGPPPTPPVDCWDDDAGDWSIEELIAGDPERPRSVAEVLAEGKRLPVDQGGSASTREVGDAIAAVVDPVIED